MLFVHPGASVIFISHESPAAESVHTIPDRGTVGQREPPVRATDAKSVEPPAENG